MKTINIKIETELSAEGFGERIPDQLVMVTHRKEIDDLKIKIARLFNWADEIEVSFIKLKDYLERFYDDEFQTGILLRALFELNISIRVSNLNKKIYVSVDRQEFHKLSDFFWKN